MSRIRDASLKAEGERKIEWVKSYMPLLNRLECEFGETRPLSGLNVSVSVHLEGQDSVSVQEHPRPGPTSSRRAQPRFPRRTTSPPRSRRAGPAACFAWHGGDAGGIRGRRTLSRRSPAPHLVIDDGGDFVRLLHGRRADLSRNLTGGCEETTTGVLRLRAREREER